MLKPALAEAPIHDLIRQRWSPRAFSDEPVSVADLRTLFEAARWASSASNEQPWHYVVGDRFRDPDAHARILSTLVPANAVWARHAPILVIGVAKKTTSRGAANRFDFYDAGAATGFLVLQATALGLAAHQMGGYDVEKARQALEIPADFEPTAAIAIGYPGDPDRLPEELKQRELGPRKRRPIEETIFTGKWGQLDLPKA